ncbi:Hypothetical membrane protein [Propionibacterium freudenreichii]|uniref:FtsX-like permease family protein n=2 Tax=Propionibacterium freudenreichii TaxID=1744 RepID=UPI0005A5CB73|nr:Hypothetical membrane protein [Propionibacterium freudenreichii]SCQ45783.1 Permease component of hypothetical ABC-typetransport system [Propionibacterium freudenreichii]SCQ50396.1 Permease component of hypothetical ABC-typetransport system [Propionibacterium freudenreichii]
MQFTSLMRLSAMVTRPGRGQMGRDSRGLMTALSISAYAIVQALALAVTAGVLLFLDRVRRPSNAFQRDFGGSYVSMAIFAGVMLLVPLASLCVSAARMGALRRARRLSIVRMLGASPRDVRVVGVFEAFAQALAGVVIGTGIYLVTLPLWSPLRFEQESLSTSQMWIGLPGLASVGFAVLVIATASAIIGLQRVAISPLGVARRVDSPAMRRARLVIPAVLIVAWLTGGQVVGQAVPAIAMLVGFSMLAALLLAVDAVGPFLVQRLGRVMARRARKAPTLIAGRRLVDDPKATWRAVGTLSMVCFLASFTAMLPVFASGGSTDADQLALLADIRNGVWLTLAIAFLLTASSTGLGQAAKTLDRIGDARNLAIAGAPAQLLTRVRRREVLVPIGVATVLPVVVGLAFQFPLIGPLITQRPDMLITLLATLVAGIGLVFAVQECCSPLQTRLLCEQQRSTD